jgi:uncharacterized membrane protein
MRHALLLIAAIALSACQPQAPGGQPATAPADAPAVSVSEGGATEAATPEAFLGDLDAHGTEPFWAVQIRETQISFSTPDSNVTGPNKGWTGGGDKLVWETLAGDKRLKITLREQAGCSDGMSDLKYPLAAEVVLGDKTFKGCASKTSEKPREGVAP